MTCEYLQDLLDQATHTYFALHEVCESAAREVWVAVDHLKKAQAHLREHEEVE
jgi:hypothetical protein